MAYLPLFGRRTIDKEAATKAVQRWDNIQHTMGTSGWADLMELVKKSEEWSFSHSVSPEFAKEVLANPSVYAQHVGYVAGLRLIESKVEEIRKAAEKAAKDLQVAEDHEQTKPGTDPH